MKLTALLRTYRDRDERGWHAEFDCLASEHADQLAASVQEAGIREPILLGTDGRVWDGHHRLAVARMLGITFVPVRLAPPPPAPARLPPRSASSASRATPPSPPPSDITPATPPDP